MVLHFNCNSFSKNKDFIIGFISTNDIDIIGLSETWSKNNSSCKLPGYTLFENSRQDGYGGMAIAVRKNIRAVRINYDSEEATIIRITNLSTNITIASSYFTPSLSNTQFETKVNNLVDNMQNHKNVILYGDFNAKLVKWGSNANHRKGSILDNIIQSSTMRNINNSKPTFHRDIINRNIHSAALDLAFTDLKSTMISWDVLTGCVNGSHHV